ncbi:MAG: hypothetical protein LCH62_17045 [Proteobacteria bacterium]|nr:hypothetical protein [Pseudomonadota bacterium]
MRRSARLIFAAGLIACLAVPCLSVAGLVSSAQAQQGEDKALTRRTDAEKRRDAEIDQQYRAATRRGDAGPAVKSDPWGSVRNQPAQGPKTTKK